MKITVIGAALPPLLDGIGDYSACLVRELVQSAEINFLTAKGHEYIPISGVRIQPSFEVGRPASIREIVGGVQKERPDWLLLQYNPFSYGRRGWNPYLPLAIRKIKRVCPQTRIALMVHERYVPSTDFKFKVMAIWQRPQFQALGQIAEVVFVSIERWAKEFETAFPQKTVVHLPVGSNVPIVAIERDAARARLGIAPNTRVLGFFGTAHASRLLNEARLAAEVCRDKGHDILVLYMGPNAETVRQALAGIPVLAEGPLAVDEISRRLSAIDIYLSTFVDGVSTRRSSLMAGMHHGMAIAGTDGFHTDTILRNANGKALLLSDVNDHEQFAANILCLLENPELRARMGREANRLYESSFAWDKIASLLLNTLRNQSLPT